MDMGAASTSNHHQGYRNESREATQSQTDHIDCRASKYQSLRSSQRQGGRRGKGRRGRRVIWQEKLWKSTRMKKKHSHTGLEKDREEVNEGRGGGETTCSFNLF